MLLLMNILRSRYRGVIHFYPADGDSSPEIEFTGGEGPEQVMDQIQDFALPEIHRSIEPAGPYLRWEELDLETGVVRRHRSRFHDRFEFVLCPDELGIELVLPADAGGTDVELGAERARPWVPLRPLAEPGADQRAAIGWSVQRPEFWWRYLQTRYAPPTIEMTWSCATLPAHWAALVLAETRHLDCRFDDDQRCPMNPTRDGLLVYRGFHPLPEDSERPASLSVLLEQPLVVVGPTSRRQQGEPDEEEHELFAEVPATVDALDFRAWIGGRPTRLVARADLDQGFEAEVLTAEDVLLPEMIPAGAIPGLPWDLEVSPQTDGRPVTIAQHGEEGLPATPEASGRRWRLAPDARPAGAGAQAGERGRWLDVTWEQELRRVTKASSLAFGLGSFNAERAPRITHIENRRASVAWRIEASDEGGSMCLCVPYWVPIGCPGRVALPPRESNGFDYGAEVRAELDGLEEGFVIDQRSEVSGNRLFLGPRQWLFRDEKNGAIAGGEALGEGAGCVRWRRTTGGDRDLELGPTEWAGGSAPVLLLRRGEANALHWGGLYAPRTVPWDALEEVPCEPTPDPEEILLVPRADAQRPIWIDLWGFICRYDVHRMVFTRSHGENSEPRAWIAHTGLELFPRQGGHLLRSFSPVYAVRDPEPRRFSLRPTQPRPTLHLGRELDAGRSPGGSPAGGPARDSLVLEISPETYVRCQLADPGRVPEVFEPGRVPGTRLRLDRVGRRVVWLAIEQSSVCLPPGGPSVCLPPGGPSACPPPGRRRRGAGRRAGYLISWDAAGGWLFRGFFAHPGAAAELGLVRQGERRCRVFLGGEGASRISTFRLTIDRRGAHWSDTAPEEVSRRMTSERIRAWETDYFSPERRPAPLESYGMRILQQSARDRPWIFEFFDAESRADRELPAGIRVWELHGDAEEELADAKKLGEDTAEIDLTAEPPAEPRKKMLQADDDDDF